MIDIWYHDDLDGLVTGAMLATALETSCTGIPVNYHNVPDTSGPMLAVVDFQFNPNAMIWIDHHASSFETTDHKKQQQQAGHPWWIWEPHAPSCALLLQRTLESRNMFPESFTAWSKMATRVDTATYDSAEDYLSLTDPGAAMAQVYSVLSSADKTLMFKSIAYGEPPVFLQRFAKLADEIRHQNQTATDAYERHAEFTNGVVHANLVNAQVPWARFSGFAMYPTAKASVTMFPRGESVVVSISGNPWNIVDLPHLGHVVQQYGGGGHARVAGMSFSNYNTALNAYWNLIREMNT